MLTLKEGICNPEKLAVLQGYVTLPKLSSYYNSSMLPSRLSSNPKNIVLALKSYHPRSFKLIS